MYAECRHLALLFALAVLALFVGAGLSEVLVSVAPALRDVAVGPTDLGSWLSVAILCAAFVGYSALYLSRTAPVRAWRLLLVVIPPLLLAAVGWYRSADALVCQPEMTSLCAFVILAYASPVVGAIAGIWPGLRRPSNNKLQRKRGVASGRADG